MDCGKKPENPTMKNVSIITADLDLAKSLSRFQEVVSPLLQLEGLRGAMQDCWVVQKL
jgi:hypothetical protein